MLLFVLCALVLALAAAWVWSTRAAPIPGIPMLPAHWYFGHLLDAVKNLDRYHDWLNGIAQHFEGKTFQSSKPGQPTCVFVQDPEAVKWVLKTNFSNYRKSDAIRRNFYDLLGDGIFNVSGEAWKKQRKIASHMFSLNVLRQDITRMVREHVEEALEVLASSGQVIDLQLKINQFTLDTICEVAFGEKMHTIQGEQGFSLAFDLAQSVIFKRSFDPLWRVKRLLSMGAEKQMKEHVRVIHDWADGIVKRRKQVQSEVLRKYPDLLSRFITEAEEQNELLTDKQLKDLVLNFLIAGRDTTACLLTWSVFALCKHPAEAKRLLEDVDSNMSKGAIIPSYDDVGRMTYVDAFLHETLRLYPPVPWESQWAIKDDVLPDGTAVPAGTEIGFNPYYFGRIKKLWGDDAAQFKAARWLKTEAERPDQFMFPVFNAGMRLCLGKPVALLEAKIMLAALLRRFHIQLSPEDQPDDYALYMILQKKGGLHVTLTDRQQ